jgi:exodeoxyribonuclease VII small subunit
MTTTPKPFAFEPALIELEEITAWFESSEADLDQGLAKFERGMELAAQLKEHLAQVENKIEKIKQKFEPAEQGSAAAAEAEEENDGRFDDDNLSEPVEPDQTGLF